MEAATEGGRGLSNTRGPIWRRGMKGAPNKDSQKVAKNSLKYAKFAKMAAGPLQS